MKTIAEQGIPRLNPLTKRKPPCIQGVKNKTLTWKIVFIGQSGHSVLYMLAQKSEIFVPVNEMTI